MQSKMTQMEALDAFRQANELYATSKYSMYQPKDFTNDEILVGQWQFLQAALLLESIPADYVSTEMKTLLAKCYLQDLYFTRHLQSSSVRTNEKHQLSLSAQHLVEKYQKLLSGCLHLTETDKRIQLMLCQVFTLGKNRGKGYSSKVTALAKQLDAYLPVDEHQDFFEKLTECERMNFAWHAENVAGLVKRNGGVCQQYLTLAEKVRVMPIPPLLVMVKPAQAPASSLVTETEKSPNLSLSDGARSALHRSREIGKSPRDELLETFSEFVKSAHEMEADNIKKAKMNP